MNDRDAQAQGVLREKGGGGRPLGIRGIDRLLKSPHQLRLSAWAFCFSWILLFSFSSLETVTVTKGDSHLSLPALSPSAKVTSQNAGKTEPAPKRLKLLVRVPGTDTDVEIREGGNFSIDITRSPVPTKSIAMRHFLQQSGLRPEQGIYIGNQNSSLEDRDGEMAKIAGLKVMAVDEDQSKVIPEVDRIGAGVNATEAKLKEILGQMRRGSRGPAFIGLDIDDTLLGTKTVVENGKERKVKEELIEDRRAIGETLAELIQRGVQLIFFSDNDSQLTKERIGDPLARLLLPLQMQQLRKGSDPSKEITFFTSGMVTSFTLAIEPAGLLQSIRYDTLYGEKYRLDSKTTNYLLQVLGRIEEDIKGNIVASGEVGKYYTQRLTQRDEKGKHQLNPSIKETYPEFITGTTPGGNVKYPEIQPRDLLDDGSVSMIAVVPVVSRYSKGNRLAPGEEDERALLVRKIATAIQRLELAGGVEVSGSGERLDRVLIGTSLADGVAITQELLEKVRSLMGVEDLVATQRIPDDKEATVERAGRAIQTIHRKLKEKGWTVEIVTQEQFNSLFGVRPVVMAAGYATRFSAFIHKTMARAGLKNTNIGYALDGSYTTPGVAPVVMIGEKILGLIAKDEYITDYDFNRHAFRVQETLTQLEQGQRSKQIDPKYLDPEKIQYYFGRSNLVFIYTKPYGHGDHMVQAAQILPTDIPYVQVAFGEMSPAALDSNSSPSFISYLEILARDADAVGGGKLSDGEIENKGNFFFNSDPAQLLSYTDWGYIPHEKSSSPHDKVADVQRRQSLQSILRTLPSDPAGRRRRIQQLRNEYPDFVISDEGEVFSQESLVAVREELRRWGSLDESRKKYLRRHYAIQESEDHSSADLLISGNSAVFRTDAVRGVASILEQLFIQGNFHTYQEGQAPDPRQVNAFWSVDPKNGETTTLAWNLIRVIANKALGLGEPVNIGFVYVGKAPSSIKDAKRQLEFAKDAPEAWRSSVNDYVPFAPETVQYSYFLQIIQSLSEGNEQTVKNHLAELVRDNRSRLFEEFHFFILGLLAKSKGESWQATLLRVLNEFKESQDSITSGYVDLAIAEAVDAGLIDPTGSDEAAAVLDSYRVSQKPGREEYLVTRLEAMIPKQADEKSEKENESLAKRRQDLLKIVGGDEAALAEALRQNEKENRLILNALVSENRVPEFDRQDRPSPLEAPEAFLITGGTSGNFFTGVLPEVIATTPPIREVRLNAIVGLAPFDDGGGSRKIMKMFMRFLGIIPPPGDEINVMAGLTSARKRWVLRYRTGKEDTGSLKQKMLQVLTMAYTGKDLSGKEIPELKGEPVDADWITFSHHLLMLAELLDENYFLNEERVKESRSTGNPEEELTIAGNSIGNFFNVGMKIFTGAYSEETKEIDPRKYSQAIQRMLAVLVIPDIHIVPSSFDMGILYAILEAPAIKIGNHEIALDEEAIQKGEIKVGETVVKVARPFGALVSFTIQGETATLIEEFGSSITRDYARNGVKVSDSVTRVIIRDRRGREAVEVLDTRGQGKEVVIGGIPVRIKGRLIIEQTNITDSLHTSPIVDIGLINEVIPRANPEYVELLEETQEVVVMGPGSNATSLLPQLFSPEIVQALVRRTQAGLPTVRVANPFADNETVFYNFGRLIRLDEKVSKQPFEKLWNRLVVNDLVTIARRAVDSKDSLRIKEIMHLIGLMNELELKKDALTEARSPGDFSKLAKLSRRAFGAEEDEHLHLKRLVEIGGIPPNFEFSDIKVLKAEMEKRHVTIYLRPLAAVIRREVRTAGAAKTEEGIGFDRSAFGEVLDEILLETSKELSIYQDLLETFDNDFTILEMEIRRMMAIFPNWTRRHVLEKMHQWWIDQEWPEGTPLLTEEDVHQMPMPKVIIANVAYTMLWLDGQHRPKDAPDRLVKAINKYLKRGGALILLSGFSKDTIYEHLVSKIDADLRHQIIVAPSSGAEAWGYTPSGDFNPEPFYSYTQSIDEKTRDIWYAIVQKVYREFELDQPLYSLTGDKIDDPVPMDIREAQITMESVGRTNLAAGVAERINASLRTKGLDQYQIRKVDGYYDIRVPVIQRLEDLFAQQFKDKPLPVNFVPIRIGTGAINVGIVTPGVGLEKLQQNRVIEGIVGPVTQREVLGLGRRKEELMTQLPKANFVIVQLYTSPTEIRQESKLFQGPPGPLGVTKLLELLLEGPRTRSSERNESALMLSL